MDKGGISGWRRNGGAAQDDGIWPMVRVVRASPAREGPRKPSMGEGSRVPSLCKGRLHKVSKRLPYIPISGKMGEKVTHPIIGKGNPSTEK